MTNLVRFPNILNCWTETVNTEARAQQWWEQQPWPNTCPMPSSFFPCCRIPSSWGVALTGCLGVHPTQGKDSAVTAAGPGVAQANLVNPNAAAELTSTQNNRVERVGVCLWPLTFTQPFTDSNTNTGYPAVSLAPFKPQRPQTYHIWHSSEVGI